MARDIDICHGEGGMAPYSYCLQVFGIDVETRHGRWYPSLDSRRVGEIFDDHQILMREFMNSTATHPVVTFSLQLRATLSQPWRSEYFIALWN